MEVHPPEHGIHSWRDFFVHMATICLGLLIAIGLEQSVEGLHHRHERRELSRRLAEESRHNLQDALDDAHNVEQKLASNSQVALVIRHALRSGDKITALPPRLNIKEATFASDPTWDAARTSGVLAIVSEQEIKAYSEVSSLIAEYRKAEYRERDARVKAGAFRAQFCSDDSCADVDLSKATATELRTYLADLTEVRGALYSEYSLDQDLYNAETTILSGNLDYDTILKSESEPLPNSHLPR